MVARGAYRELLDAQWTMGALPADHATLKAIVGASTSEWRRAWPYLSPKFPACPDGMLRNPRLEEHRARAVELYNKRKSGADKTNAGKRGQVLLFPPRGEQ